MTTNAYQVSSPAAALDARSVPSGVPSWRSCAAAVPTVKAIQAIRVRMHDGFLTARRPKERSDL